MANQKESSPIQFYIECDKTQKRVNVVFGCFRSYNAKIYKIYLKTKFLSNFFYNNLLFLFSSMVHFYN